MNLFSKQNIVVSPEKIRQQAQLARYLYERLLDHMSVIERKIAASAYFWSSESSSLLYKYFEEDNLDYNEIRIRLQRQIEHLNQIAAIYENSEKVSQETASGLPETIIK